MLVQHSIVYLSSRLLAGILSAITTLLLTHLLSPEQYGVYGFALVIMLLTSNVAFDWLGLSFTRLGQERHADPRVLTTVVCFFGSIVFITGLIMLLVLLYRATFHVGGWVIFLGVLLAWTTSWFELATRYEIMRFRPWRYLGMTTGRVVFGFVGSVGAAWLTHDAIWTGLGATLGLVIGAVFGSFPWSRLNAREFDRKFALEMLGFGLPLAVGIAVDGLAFNGPRIVIQFLDSSIALGHYTAAYLLVVNSLVIISSGLSYASYSLAIRAVESGDFNAIRHQLWSNGALLIAVLAPAALGMALTAKGIAAAFVGPDFAPAVAKLTPWMSASTFFWALRGNFLDQAFQLSRRPDLQVLVATITAIIAIGLSIFLVGPFGPIGAAISITVALSFSCCVAFLIGRTVFPMPLPIGPIARDFSLLFVYGARRSRDTWREPYGAIRPNRGGRPSVLRSRVCTQSYERASAREGHPFALA